MTGFLQQPARRAPHQATRYTSERWEQLRPKYVFYATISACLLILMSGMVASIYGVQPVVQVTPAIRELIVWIWFFVLCVFLYCGGMLLWAWLVGRYGDRA